MHARHTVSAQGQKSIWPGTFKNNLQLNTGQCELYGGVV